MPEPRVPHSISTPIVVALERGDGKRQLIKGAIHIVEGLLHRVDIRVFAVRSSSEKFGLTTRLPVAADIHVANKTPTVNVREMIWEDGLLKGQ